MSNHIKSVLQRRDVEPYFLELWSGRKHSASQIAGELSRVKGIRVTKGMVLGRINRLGLLGQGGLPKGTKWANPPADHPSKRVTLPGGIFEPLRGFHWSES